MNANAPWPAAIIFDLDGTLIDSAPDIAAAVSRALSADDITVEPDEVRDYIGDGAARLLERVLAARDRSLDAATLEARLHDFHAAYADAPCTHTVCYDGALEMLDAARQQGCRLAICTNKPQAIAERVLAGLALESRIDVLIGAGTYQLKPDPEPLLACLAALGSDREAAIYVGDMAVDREAARAACLPVVLTRFGYAGNDVAELGPDAVLDTWQEWPAVCKTLATARRTPS
ncbi:phosphoglycolate phosphatase [Salinisphaera sp. Q1T1-3]|uniref:phosphoglycolate phosphatase n=1 Tax=Salinisphaera sp. Q1T1-3 TaxID=2321229 RepID=UPI000E72C6CB|nr:phosphoglycolate phosphatase [Salinisphaera sp. Q1T1-3]RJS95242.1 phosphoglycolate phosphatase [Salinisphaera sp. Q1T1-3]